MNLPMFFVVFTAIACAATVSAELRGKRLGVWLFKPLASAGFVLLALALWQQGCVAASLLLAGLVASWLGDVLLIPEHSSAAFLAGFAAFAAAHICYLLAFLQLQPDWHYVIKAAAALLLVAVLIWRHLFKHLEGPFRLAVPLYTLVILAMVAISAGVYTVAGGLLLAGALVFAVSDIFVAQERFVGKAPINTWLGLPLYYLAQLLIASSMASLCIN